jgi:glycerol-3-phosphate dehydrogenase
MKRTEVLIIGGGLVGLGTARDLALRGVQVTLVERGDFFSGASGANHGMLHSGARYAVGDPKTAAECAAESGILKRIAPGCIDPCGGLFVATGKDDPNYLDTFLRAARANGVAAEEATVEEARQREPMLGPIVAAARVEDASIDPFALALANVRSARAAGSLVFNHHEVTGLRRGRKRIDQVSIQNAITGKGETIKADIVVNAAGAWGPSLAAMAGVSLPLQADKGTMVVLDGRIVNGLVNRLRPPSDGDIIVPNHSASIIGTTSERPKALDQVVPTREEVLNLIAEAAEMVPPVKHWRAVRAYAGVRLLAEEGGRRASRGFQIIDHDEEGVDNLISAVGGKLTTYRLVAENAADKVVSKLGRTGSCRTAVESLLPLPDSGRWVDLPEMALGRMARKYGQAAPEIARHCAMSLRGPEMLCSCEQVLRGEAEVFAADEDVRDLPDLMRRTRAGMGYCQSGLCALGLLSVMPISKTPDPREDVGRFLAERWKGVEPVLGSESLRQEVLKAYLLEGTYSLGRRVKP